MIRSQSYRSLF